MSSVKHEERAISDYDYGSCCTKGSSIIDWTAETSKRYP